MTGGIRKIPTSGFVASDIVYELNRRLGSGQQRNIVLILWIAQPYLVTSAFGDLCRSAILCIEPSTDQMAGWRWTGGRVCLSCVYQRVVEFFDYHALLRAGGCAFPGGIESMHRQARENNCSSSNGLRFYFAESQPHTNTTHRHGGISSRGVFLYHVSTAACVHATLAITRASRRPHSE